MYLASVASNVAIRVLAMLVRPPTVGTGRKSVGHEKVMFADLSQEH